MIFAAKETVTGEEGSGGADNCEENGWRRPSEMNPGASWPILQGCGVEDLPADMEFPNSWLDQANTTR